MTIPACQASVEAHNNDSRCDAQEAHHRETRQKHPSKRSLNCMQTLRGRITAATTPLDGTVPSLHLPEHLRHLDESVRSSVFASSPVSATASLTSWAGSPTRLSARTVTAHTWAENARPSAQHAADHTATGDTASDSNAKASGDSSAKPHGGRSSKASGSNGSGSERSDERRTREAAAYSVRDAAAAYGTRGAAQGAEQRGAGVYREDSQGRGARDTRQGASVRVGASGANAQYRTPPPTWDDAAAAAASNRSTGFPAGTSAGATSAGASDSTARSVVDRAGSSKHSTTDRAGSGEPPLQACDAATAAALDVTTASLETRDGGWIRSTAKASSAAARAGTRTAAADRQQQHEHEAISDIGAAGATGGKRGSSGNASGGAVKAAARAAYTSEAYASEVASARVTDSVADKEALLQRFAAAFPDAAASAALSRASVTLPAQSLHNLQQGDAPSSAAKGANSRVGDSANSGVAAGVRGAGALDRSFDFGAPAHDSAGTSAPDTPVVAALHDDHHDVKAQSSRRATADTNALCGSPVPISSSSARREQPENAAATEAKRQQAPQHAKQQTPHQAQQQAQHTPQQAAQQAQQAAEDQGVGQHIGGGTMRRFRLQVASLPTEPLSDVSNSPGSKRAVGARDGILGSSIPDFAGIDSAGVAPQEKRAKVCALFGWLA